MTRIYHHLVPHSRFVIGLISFCLCPEWNIFFTGMLLVSSGGTLYSIFDSFTEYVRGICIWKKIVRLIPRDKKFIDKLVDTTPEALNLWRTIPILNIHGNSHTVINISENGEFLRLCVYWELISYKKWRMMLTILIKEVLWL